MTPTLGMLETDLVDVVRFQDRVRVWNKYNFPVKTSDQDLKGMVEELGELAHADLKLEQGIRGNEDHLANAKDAVGDLLVYTASYCNQKGWSLAECMAMAWNSIKDRDWQRFPKNGKTE